MKTVSNFILNTPVIEFKFILFFLGLLILSLWTGSCLLIIEASIFLGIALATPFMFRM